jgi:predicted GNAT family N-acyltransferase
VNFLTIPLEKGHIKADFSCGKLMLDDYIKYQAGQDIRRKLSACFVLSDQSSGKIKGYFTLSNSSMPLKLLPIQYQKNIPVSYRSIPAILLGRLAVSKEFQGSGLGTVLLIDALKRCVEISSTLGSFAVIVDPLDNAAENFYLKYGFLKLPDCAKMFIPMKTIAQQFEK